MESGSQAAAKPVKTSLFKRIGNLFTDTNGNMRWQAALMCVTVLVAVCGLVAPNVGAVVSFRENLLHNHPSGESQTTEKVKAALSADPLHAHWDDVKGAAVFLNRLEIKPCMDLIISSTLPCSSKSCSWKSVVGCGLYRPIGGTAGRDTSKGTICTANISSDIHACPNRMPEFVRCKWLFCFSGRRGCGKGMR